VGNPGIVQTLTRVTTSLVTLTAAQKNNLRAIQWQVPTQYYYTTPFDFCVSDLTPILG
jgi:hypothetical protein